MDRRKKKVAKRKRDLKDDEVEELSKRFPNSKPEADVQCDTEEHANSSVDMNSVTRLKDAFKLISESVAGASNIDIPDHFNIMDFAKSRASEIATIMKEVQCKKPKLILQQLPHYMRRRAASHNANRVPRRVREKAAFEISKAKKSKRPSRKHRRRPSNLLEEYQRRAKKCVWMETHIWFAKRFKMESLWGYRIPLHPNDKNQRSAYKSSVHYAMLQDMSYLCCLELEGLQHILLDKLSLLTSTSIGSTFASKASLSGQREGRTVLYNPGSFPFHAIGPVTFLWQPISNEGDGCAQKLWIWCHPSMHEELVHALIKVFSLQCVSECPNYNESNNTDSSSGAVFSDPKDHVELADKKFADCFRKVARYNGESVQLLLLKDKLVRHRLTGPSAQAIMSDVLQLANVQCKNGTEGKWWKTYYSSKESLKVEDEKKDFWNKITSASSPSDVPSHIAIGLTVKDPRVHLPQYRTKVEKCLEVLCFSDPNHLICLASIPQSIAVSPLWDESIRDEVTATKIPESQLNKMKSQLVVPGSKLDLGDDEPRIPIIVIQNPDVDGFGSGWDVIYPLGWGMAFWIACVYRKARAYGLRELRSVTLDKRCLLPPYNYPDAKCGELCEEDNRKAEMEKYLRRPPAKRPNFKKLGVSTPFFMPWSLLVSEWVKEMSSTLQSAEVSCLVHTTKESDSHLDKDNKCYYVLRDKRKLFHCEKICKLFPSQTQKLSGNQHLCRTIDNSIKKFENCLLSDCLQCSIICVQFQSFGKGTICAYSGVYLAHEEDLQALQLNSSFEGPKEPVHNVALKDNAEIDPDKLKRPAVTNFVNHCSRKLIGYIESGGYSFRYGSGFGIGHCTLIGLLELMRTCLSCKSPLVVLIRPQHSFQYRFATMEINMQM